MSRDHCVRKIVPLRTARLYRWELQGLQGTRPQGHRVTSPFLVLGCPQLPLASQLSTSSTLHFPARRFPDHCSQNRTCGFAKRHPSSHSANYVASPSPGGKVVRAGQKAPHNFQRPTKGDGRHAGMGLNRCGQKYGLGDPCPRRKSSSQGCHSPLGFGFRRGQANPF